MIAFSIILLLFILSEYVGDFLLQPREMALKKSESLWWNFLHCLIVGSTISAMGLIAFYLTGGAYTVLLTLCMVAPVYAIFHGIQDWYIWKWYKSTAKNKGEDFKYWEDKNFYNTIGLDRTLHMITGVVLILLFIQG